MDAGWIKAHRGMLDHPALQTQSRMTLWVVLLMRAAHAGKKVNWKGQSIGLLPGQMAISLRQICRQYEIPHKAARGAIDRFTREGMLIESPILGTVRGTGKGTVGSLISICNWEAYQISTDTEGTVEGTVGAHQGHSRGTQNKNVRMKEDKNLDAEAMPDQMYSSPNGDALEFDFDRDLYRMAEQLFGPKGRGLATRAKQKLGDLGKAVNLFQAARTKAEPREYIMKSLGNATKRRSDLCKA